MAASNEAVSVIGGLTQGVPEWVGIIPSGRLTWLGSAVIVADDRVFSASLSNETFNTGWFGPDEGSANGAVVQATPDPQLDHGFNLTENGAKISRPPILTWAQRR